MPAWNQLNDEEIAALLNTVTAGWAADDQRDDDGLEPYTAEEIEAARGLGLSAAEVRDRRPDIPAR